MNAYDKAYLEDAMSNLAVMLDYGSMTYGDPELFFDRFLVSDISKQFGSGSPRYIAGMSGIELAEKVIEDKVLSVMAVGVQYSPSELVKLVDLADVPNTQKLTPRLTALVADNKVVKETVKGRSVYSLPKAEDTDTEE